jgi:hypothetical protein
MTAFPVIVGLSSSIIFLILFVKLMQRNRTVSSDSMNISVEEAWSEQWFNDFSAFRYTPMRRLLSAEEEEYWVRSNGDTKARREEFRAERRRLFREYLGLISADFQRLSQGARLSIVHAAEDRSADIEQLLTLEWSLRKMLWMAHVRVGLHWLGLKPVEPTEIINALQGFEFSLREIRVQSVSA